MYRFKRKIDSYLKLPPICTLEKSMQMNQEYTRMKTPCLPSKIINENIFLINYQLIKHKTWVNEMKIAIFCSLKGH